MINMSDVRPIQFLLGERVYARPIEQEDIDLFYKKALWDPEGRRLTGTQTFFSRKGVQDWFEKFSLDQGRIDLLICLRETDEAIGEMAMLDIDHLNQNAIVRISIFNQAYWGNGYGTEALKLLVKYGFNNLNLNRIGLDVFAYNDRALKSYKKIGFQEEGRVREALFYDGAFHDSIIMGILRSEFQAR